jgi:hypothetical protein
VIDFGLLLIGFRVRYRAAQCVWAPSFLPRKNTRRFDQLLIIWGGVGAGGVPHVPRGARDKRL